MAFRLVSSETNDMPTITSFTVEGIEALKTEERERMRRNLLLAFPSSSKLWRLFYRVAGRQRTLAPGAFTAVSLAEAKTNETKPGPWFGKILIRRRPTGCKAVCPARVGTVSWCCQT
jgi:hypothetical protein